MLNYAIDEAFHQMQVLKKKALFIFPFVLRRLYTYFDVYLSSPITALNDGAKNGRLSKNVSRDSMFYL